MIALNAVGLDAKKAAVQLGYEREAVVQWINNSTKNIKNRYLWKLEDITGYNARWITIGEGPPLKIKSYLDDPKIASVVGVMEPMPDEDKDIIVKISNSIAQSKFDSKNKANG